MSCWHLGLPGRIALLLVGVWLCALAQAQPGETDAAARQRLARERAAIEARFEAAHAACEGQFAVTACQDRARAERRSARDQVKRQQMLLDTSLRRERAAERLRRIQDKQAQADARAASDQAAAPGAASPNPARRAPRATDPVDRDPRGARPVVAPSPTVTAAPKALAVPARPVAARAARSVDPAKRSDKQLDKTADYERRQAAFQAHRDAVARRNEARAARQKPAAALPPRPGLPGASAAAARP